MLLYNSNRILMCFWLISSFEGFTVQCMSFKADEKIKSEMLERYEFSIGIRTIKFKFKYNFYRRA